MDDGADFSERGSSYHNNGGQFLNNVNTNNIKRESESFGDSIYHKGGKDFTEDDDSVIGEPKT